MAGANDMYGSYSALCMTLGASPHRGERVGSVCTRAHGGEGEKSPCGLSDNHLLPYVIHGPPSCVTDV